MLPPYIDIFLSPIRDNAFAQIGTIALLFLTLLDIIFGVVNAMFFQHNFSSHKFRMGLFRKLGNFGMLAVADILDALLLGGFDLGLGPIYLGLTSGFIIMEVASIAELYGAVHPDFQKTQVWQFFKNAKSKSEAELGEEEKTLNNTE